MEITEQKIVQLPVLANKTFYNNLYFMHFLQIILRFVILILTIRQLKYM